MSSTKKSWLLSLLSLLLCVSMLLGSTFAWFTDTTTTGVNTIQAGKLDVVLEMWNGEKWVDAEGETLQFVDMDQNELWEPGCTYTLQNIRVRNAGDLHLKYMIAITGIGGDAKLNEVIEWTANGADMSTLSADKNLAPGEDSGAIAIQGHMKEEAGNEYQGLSIDNISITVYATQYSAESDSFGNTYDKEATYPSIVKDLSVSVDITGKVGADSKLTEEVVISGKGIRVTLPVGTLVETGTTKLTLKIKEDYVNNNITLGITAGYDVTVEGVAAGNTAPIVVYMPKVMPKNQSAIQIFHDGVLMEQMNTVDDVSKANSQGTYGDRYFYDKATGDVTFAWTHFSNVSIGADSNVIVNGETMTGFTEINLNDQTGDVTVEAGQKVILTWTSGDTSKVNALTANPITAIFTNETPNPGDYYSGTITVKTGATVVLNGVNIRTDGTKDALSIYDTGEYTTTTTIYVADGTRNYLVGRCGIGVDTTGTSTWGNDIVLEGGGFLCATAMQQGCPAIGPSAWNSMFDITIDVGHLRAHPHKNAAGISGGSSWRGFGDIVINGGIIQSYSGGNAAAIGSGINGNTTSITVNAGKVYCYNQPWTANHHAMGAGTYSGTCNSIKVYGNAYIYAGSFGVFDLANNINTINKSGFKATTVEFITTMEKFGLVFENTDSYLYRVGNMDAVSLGSLFTEEMAVVDTDVAVTVEKVGGTASGTYTANTSDWRNGKIQFSGLGSVKVTITDNKSCKPTVLYLEVVNAENVTSGGELIDYKWNSGTSTSKVLLADLEMISDVTVGGTVFKDITFNGNSVLYGNGFSITCNETSGSNDKGIITLTDNAAMDNVRIIVADHSDVFEAGKGVYNSAVKVEGGNVTISNCFIQGGRAAIKSTAAKLTVENTTLYGGAFANMLLGSGEVTLNNVTTAQYKTNGKMGFGILFDEGATATLNINGSLNQYNWISPEDSGCFNYTFGNGEYSDIISGIFNNYSSHLSDGKMNLSIMWGTSLNSVTINDYAATGYTKLLISASGSEMYAYTPAANSVVETFVNNYTPKQGVVKPVISYSFPTDKGSDNSYVYYDGILHIGVASGSTTEVDALSNASVSNGTLTVSGDGFVNGKRSFTADAEGGVLTYTLSCKGYNLDGTPSNTTKTFTQTLEYTVEKAAWKPAEMSVKEGTVYYTYSGSNYYANIPIYAGITITDYDESGNATTTTYDGKTAIDSSRFSWSIAISNSSNGKFATYGEPATNSKLDSGILYIKTKEAINGQQNGEVYITFSYVGNNGETVTCQGTYVFDSNTSKKNELCVTSDTLISLADGTQKRVDEVTADDILLTWDFHTGTYAAAPASILFYHGDDIWTVTTLNFSDGTSVRMINDHGFFDTSVNNFVYITPENADEYLGHSFIKANGDDYTEVTLVNYSVADEYTGSYSIQTAFYNNFMVEGMLSVTPPAYEGWFDYFNITDDMIYDEDHMAEEIAKYGLTPYEEYAHLVTYEQFMAFNGQYLDILIGRGVLTKAQVIELIGEYVPK